MLPSGAAVAASAGSDLPLHPRGPQRTVVWALGHHMPRLVAAAVSVAAAEVLAGIAVGETVLLGSASLTAAFGILVLLAGRLLRIGMGRWVAPLLATGVFLIGFLSAILLPGAATAAAMLPILSVVLLLPGRGRSAVAAILGLALAGSGLILLMAGVPHVFPPMREPLGSIFASATLLVVAVLILGALTDFAIQAEESLDGMHAAMRSNEAASAEHAAIVISLGTIERQDTIEATSNEIVNALRQLPSIDLAGVFATNGLDLEIIGLVAPPNFPVRQGDSLPATRARYVLDRSQIGPWAERWADDPRFGAYGAAFTASGIKGQAYAPVLRGRQAHRHRRDRDPFRGSRRAPLGRPSRRV